MRQISLLCFCLLITLSSVAQQQKAVVKGTIRDSLNEPIASAYVNLVGTNSFTLSDDQGNYKLEIPADTLVRLAIAYFGKPTRILTIQPQAPGSVYQEDIRMQYGVQLQEYVLTSERDRDKVAVQFIDPKAISSLPNPTGSFETILKSVAGVTSGNEMSAQYNVRGGNYDENLIYVNDIEIYRPLLPRTGQQEGLSFIHSEMVQNVKFSAGGFEARYGDKLSSVLDIKYREPKKLLSTVNASLLGIQAHTEGSSPNRRFTYLIGARYWNNQLLVSSLNTQGDYKPSFSDVQALLTYHLRDNLSVSVLGAYARNKYLVVPETRETVFGTVKNALALRMFFEGSDLMQYTTSTAAMTLNYLPSTRWQLKLYSSLFNSEENEFFTVEGAYRLEELETDFGSDNFGKSRATLGVGYFMNNARNTLQATVANAGHRGTYSHGNQYIQWGFQIQYEDIADKVNEWRFLDSLGFAKPGPNSNGEIVLDEFVRSRNHITSTRLSGYLQNSQLLNKTNNLRFNYGIRSNWWSYNNENVISPRFQVSFEPNLAHNRGISSRTLEGLPRKDIVLKAAFGVYYQPPMYREFRDFNGVLNPSIRAQRSIHYIVGGDMNFKAWGRPFKFFSEAYFKQLDNLIPYEVDNVRIRYYATNSAKGYATGIDFRVNGEFVKGTESWFTLSAMKTQEQILQTVNGVTSYGGYVRRPTDQRITASVMFQDYLPNFPTFRVHVNGVYGSGFPFGPPDHDRYGDTLDMPSYKRVDIGFLKILVEENAKNKVGWKRYVSSALIGIEIFNVLDVNNTISYLWIQDITGRTWAVPNYLTSRRLNLRVIVKF